MRTQTQFYRLISLLLIVSILSASAPPPAVTAPSRGTPGPVHGQAEQAEQTVTPTTEWVNFYGLRLFVDGEPAPVGTRVQANNPRGVLAGEFVVAEAGMYGLMPVYRDDPETPEEEGLLPGEKVSFTVNGRAAMALGPDEATWTAKGDLKRVDLAVGQVPAPTHRHTLHLPLVVTGAAAPDKDRTGDQVPSALPPAAPASASGSTIVIPLRSGWNLISFPVTLAHPDPTTVLSSVAGLFSVVLSFDRGGLSYYPNVPPSMNTLRSMDGYHGYWIKMNSPGTLAVSGERLAENQAISLYTGWNLVSYLPKSAQDVATALASIGGQFSVVLGFDQGGLSYYPSLPPELNTLKSLDLSHGYWIKMTSTSTLTYPVAPQTATPVPTQTPLLALPNTPTPLPSPSPTPTLGPRIAPVYPPAVISSNTTWRATDGTYVLSNTVTINQGVVLTLEPGVVVKFNDNTGLIVNGTLVAEGTASGPIVFTSIRDDAYGGDTNSDGTMSTPGASDWGNVYFAPTSTNSRLKYMRATYGGRWTCCDPWEQPAVVFVSGASPTIEDVTIEYGTTYGLLLANSASPTVRSSRISRIAGTGVRINSSSAPILENNLIESNNGYAIFMEANTAPRFSGNRAVNNGTNGVGVSGIIAPSVTWDSDLPYVIDGGLSINAGISLNLQPGAVVKFKDQGQSLTVNGTLRAPGIVTNPIVLTSLKDDTVGGDTNNDGSASWPAPGDWQSITFSNSSTNCLMDYVIVRYGGYNNTANVNVNGSAPTINHSQITHSSSHGLRLTNVAMPAISDSTIADNNGNGLDMATSSWPTLTNNGFVNNAGFAIRMEGNCSLTASGNTASNNTHNGVGVNGAVPTNTTWPANLPYIVDGGVTVNSGVVLTLQPGVVVKFRSGNFLVNGTLRANGTAGNKIVFTSLNDVSALAAGQTLGRVSRRILEAALGPGDWGRIELASTSSGSTLNYVVVRYGGSGSYGSVYLNGGAPSISNSIISYSSNHGLYVSGSSPVLMNNVFTANGNAGIYATTFANPSIQNNLIYGNAQYGVYNNSSGSVTIDAANNWWGHDSGPTHSSNPGGTGDRVSNGVSFTPWLTTPAQPIPTPYPTPTSTPAVNYVGGTISTHTTWTRANSPYVVNNDVTVNNGVILTIQPGVVVKFQNGRRLTVNGILAAAGTVEDHIVFTADKDDAYGGDTNGDGAATRPAPGNWSGIYLNAAASASNLAYVLIRYASTAIQIDGSSPTISNATIMYSSGSAIYVRNAGAPTIQNSILRDNLGAGISLSGSSPLIQSNVFVNNGDAAITMDGNSLPDNSSNQAYYNKYNGIKVSGTAGTRGSWHRDLPYVIDGGLTVATGVVLTIEPGTIIKFTLGSLTVNGGLVANGTSSSRIIFTSIHNDLVGGDTNNNGSQTWPAPGNWSLIHFTASSLSSSSLTYADITYGGYEYRESYSYYYTAVRVTGASLTIANNLIAYSNGAGLFVESLGTPTIRDNIIRHNRSDGLVLGSSSAPIIQNNQFISNQGYAVHMEASCTPTFVGNVATDNRTNGVGVWGNASATTTWKANLPYIVERVTIDAGVTVTLEPGAIVKFASLPDPWSNYGYIEANGALVAQGTLDNPIVFTSIKDDSAGGDTNNDGHASTPAPRDWMYIRFAASSSTSRLNRVQIRYGGYEYCSWGCTYYPSLFFDGSAVPVTNVNVSYSHWDAIWIKNASPTWNNVTISNSRAGIYLENAHPTISNSTIRDNSVYGIYGTSSTPTITSSTISNNAEYGIYGNALNPTITSSTISNSKRGIYIENGQNGRPTISNSTISDNTEYGIYGNALNPTITGSIISNSKRGLSLYNMSAPYPNISGNTFANNQEYAASLEVGALPTLGANTLVGTIGNAIWIGGGALTANATLHAGVTYVLGQVTVEQAATLTIEPGTIVKFDTWPPGWCCNGFLLVRGTLTANGMATNKITFTSVRDDAYGGDSNHDGTASAPAAGNWGPIYFGPTSSTSSISHVILKYAGAGLSDSNQSFYGAIAANNASPTISNLTIDNSGSYGIQLVGASPSITGSTITGQSYAIWATSSSFPTITGNTLSSSSYGIYLDDSSRGAVSGNTFGSNPTAIYLKADALPSVGQNTALSTTGNGIVARSGTIASNTTLYSGFVYVLDYTTVNAGTVLTLQPGTVIKIYNGGYLLMRGRLAAQGTADQKIVITAYCDDTYGGDTNNDGANTTPSPGYWRGIYLGTSDSNLDHIILKYGGMGGLEVDGTWYDAILILNNVSPTISHSTIARSSSKGIHVINANPSINNNDIWGNYYGIYTQNGARPTMHDNTIRDNSQYGVYNADTTLVVDAVNNSWGHDSGPAPVGAGNGVNYSDVWDPNTQSYIRTYYVAFDPWNGKTHWIEHNLGVLKQWIAYAAEPVNTATGNYTYNYQDLRIPGRGLSLTFHRFYNSLSTYQGPLGYGWTFNYGMTVREEDGNALVMVEDGRVDKYVPDGSGGYTPPKGVYAILTKSGGTFTLKRKDQTRYNFDASGKLASIVDKNTLAGTGGNTITLSYTGGNLTTVTDPTGRGLTLSYDGNNRITQIADPAGRTIRFAYDEFGNLISVTDARGNTTTYAYDSKHRLLTITDPNSHIFVTNIYDAEGRVITQRDARLNNTTFSYDTNAKVTRVTDPRGNTTNFTYDAELRLQSERDPAGQTISYGYDTGNNRIRVTDRRGNITRYAYDAMGNTTVITDALAGVTTMTYDGMNNLTGQTDPLGRATTYTYDAKGNLISTTDALGNTTTFAYDANGLMTSTTDARSNTTTFGYDSHGNQTSITDPLGNTTTSTYDIVGRRPTETDALGRTATYTYDVNNNLLTVTDAAGGVTTYTYDAVGNRLTVTDPLERVTRYAYDQKDKLISVTNPLGGVTRYEYDANDNKIRETDPLTHTTTFVYDSLNRLTQVTDPLNKTTSYGYDVDSNRTSVTDANGKTTNFTYDAINRLTRVTDPLLNTTSYVYDAVGNKIRVIDANGNTTHYEYDALNRLVKVTDALGGVVRYAYDTVGNKTSMTDANTHTTTYAYDALNRLTRVTDPLGNQVQCGYDAVGNRISLTNARGQTTTFTYDALNRLTGINYPDGSTVAYTYDAVGNRTQMVDATGTTTYAYDALNRVTSITNPGSRVVNYSYDSAGNRTGVTYPDGKAVTYTYDDANRLIRVSDWASRQTAYAYDNVGNLTGQTNPNNTTVSLTYDATNRLTGLINTSTVSSTVASFSYTMDRVGNRIRVVDTEGTTTYEYDKLYRLTNVTYPDATFGAYQYDPMGNRTVMTTTLGVTSYTYDAADRLLSTGPIIFTWDTDGNMLSKGGMTFTYDGANRLTRVVSGTLTVDFAYDGDGRRASKTVNGTMTEYIYDTIAGLAYVLTEQTGSNVTLYTYGTNLIAQTALDGTQSYYHYDGLGSTRALTGGSGQITARYSYDAFGMLHKASGTGSTSFQFAGEQADETSLIYLRARYYDPETGRFLSKDPVPGRPQDTQSLNLYVYARNNPPNLVDPSGEWFWAAVGTVFIIATVIEAVSLIVEGVRSFQEGVNIRYREMPALIENPNATSEDWDRLNRRYIDSMRNFATKTSQGLVSMPGTSLSGPIVGPGGLPSSFYELALDRIGSKLDDWIRKEPIKKVQELYFDRVLHSESRISQRFGLSSFGSWAARSDGSLSRSAYEEHLSSTPLGRIVWEAARNPRQVSQANITSGYVPLMRVLQQAGFNPAHPQPPPSGSK